MATCVSIQPARADRESEQGHGQETSKHSSDHLLLSSPIPYKAPNEESNMAEELKNAMRRHSSRTLMVDAASGRHWTGAEMLNEASRIATGLVKHCNLKPDDVVLTICDHTDQEILLALGVILAGGALYGSNPNDGFEEERSLCELVPPALVVANSRLHHMVVELKRQVAAMQTTRIVWIDNPIKECSAREDDNNNNNNQPDYYLDLIQRDQVILFSDLKAGELDEPLIDEIVSKRIKGKEHQLTYMLTSGSTGRPKVVPSTHLELLHGMASMLSACQSVPPLLPLSADSVLAGDLPLDHGAGVNTMLLSFILGAKFIVMRSYDEDSFWQAVNDYKINSSISSTTFAYKLFSRLKQLIDTQDTSRWNLDSFKFIACCGSKLAFVDLINEVQRHYTWLNVCQCYGCTEIGFISMLRVEDCRSHTHSVGNLFPGLRAKVIDCDSLRPLPANERGELHVWARSKFQGYRCHPEVDASKLNSDCHDSQGFYKLGDQVHYDEQERLYVHGRFKDTLFLMEDWKILPAELEQVVDTHPLVAQSVVVGVPDPDLPGCDAPKAFVRLLDTSSREFELVQDEQLKRRWLQGDLEFIANDIYKFVADRTAKPKHLKGGVRIMSKFPTVGLLNKVDRKALKKID